MNHKVGKHFEGLKDLDEMEIIETLSSNAYDVESEKVEVKLTAKETKKSREILIENELIIQSIIDEKAVASKGFSDRLKEPIKARKKALYNLMNGTKTVEQTVYNCEFRPGNLMFIYDQTGMCIRERELTEAEQQTSLIPGNEAGN
jgi:hypothetical protein